MSYIPRVHWKSTNISEECVVSTFRTDAASKQTSTGFLLGLLFSPEYGDNTFL
jgi:hypothetical protein